MASGRIPPTRDNALYSAVLEVLRTTRKPMSSMDLRTHKQIAPLLKNKPTGKLADVIRCLGVKAQIQIGYTEGGIRIATSIDQPAPGFKTNPTIKQSNNGSTPVKKAFHPRPGRRNYDLYDATMNVINNAPGVVTMHDLRIHQDIAPMLVGQRSGRMNEVMASLKLSGQVQVGYDENCFMVVAAKDKPFNYPTSLPKGKRTRFQKLGAGDIAAAAAAATAKAMQQEQAPQPGIEPHAPANTATPLQTFSLDAMVQQFAEALGAKLGHALAETFTKSFMQTAVANMPPQFVSAAMTAPPATTPQPDKKPCPKVIVAGLLPQQAGLIQQEFGAKLDFAFVEASEVSNSKRIDQLLASHDAAFAMTGFINHSLYGKLRGAKEFRHVSGGMTTLRNELNGYIEKHGHAVH